MRIRHLLQTGLLCATMMTTGVGEVVAEVAIAVVGDLQRTTLPEWLIGREQNDAERERVVAAIARARPEALVLLGDMAAIGCLESSWETFDRVIAPVREAGIPLFPILGNHDYAGPDSWALPHIRARWPDLAGETWSVRRHGRLALIRLDSNRGALGRRRWSRQIDWLGRVLNDLDEDPAVSAAVVLVHHPPFSNSASRRDSKVVREQIVPLFERSVKGVLMLSGHAHTYERFQRQDRHYVVSGGGGGPRVEVLPREKERWPAVYHGPPVRPFHFLEITPGDRKLWIRARGFDSIDEALRTFDEFAIPFP